MANILDSLRNMAEIPADMILQVLETAINAIGTGTEWTGEQIETLGELEQLFADKLTEIRER